MRDKYLDRPLTNEEKLFASNPENHDLIYKYIKHHRLDLNEWYDILILHYLRAIKKYCSIERLQSYKFEQILYRTLDNGRSRYFRDMNRKIRMPIGGFVSLDCELEGENSFNKGKLDVNWIDNNQDVEKNFLTRDFVMQILKILDDIQQQIFYMLIEDYSKTEIARTMNMNMGTLNRQIDCMRKNIHEQFIDVA